MAQLRTRLRLALLILSASLAGQRAAATVRIEFTPPDTTSWYGWRSLRFQPAYALKDVGYDSNIFLSSDHTNPVGDFTATVGAAGRGLLQFGRGGFLTFKGGVDYVWFDQYASQSHFNYVFGVKGNLSLGDLRAFGEAEYQKHDERPSNEIDQRTRRVNELVRGGFGYEYSSVTAVDLIFAHERIRYTDKDFLNVYSCLLSPEFPYPDCPTYTIGDLLDHVERSLTLRFVHMLTGRTQIVADLSDRRYDFTGPMPDPAIYETVPIVGPIRNTVEQRAMAGLDFLPGGKLFGKLRVGMTNFSPEVLVDQQTRQAVWEIDLSWRPTNRLLFEGAFDKNFYFSVYGANAYYQQNHKALQCIVYLNRFLGVEGAYESFLLRYPVPDPSTQASSDGSRNDIIRILRAGLRTKLKGRTVMTLRVAQRRRTSTVPGLNDRDLLVTTGVETIF